MRLISGRGWTSAKLRWLLWTAVLQPIQNLSFKMPHHWFAHFKFSSSDKGVLHKSVVFEGEVHIVEEIQLLKNSESIKNLLLSSKVGDICTETEQYL